MNKLKKYNFFKFFIQSLIDKKTLTVNDDEKISLNILQSNGLNDYANLVKLGNQSDSQTVPNGSYEIDLSQYIPNDGYEYNVIGYVYATVNDVGSANDRIARIFNEDKSKIFYMLHADGVAGKNVPFNNCYFAHLDSNSRKLNLVLNSTDNIGEWQYVNMTLFWWQKTGG